MRKLFTINPTICSFWIHICHK